MKFINSPFTIFNISNRIILDIIINNHLQWQEYDKSVFSLEKCNVFSIIFSRKVLCIFHYFLKKSVVYFPLFSLEKCCVFTIIFSTKTLFFPLFSLEKCCLFTIIFSTKTLFFLLFSLKKTLFIFYYFL